MTALMILFFLGVVTGGFTTWALELFHPTTKTVDASRWTVTSITARIQQEQHSYTVTQIPGKHRSWGQH
ncbi:hypothetical protein ACFVUS_34785 [Nocardia sp. NPDC058058]|uniref:hypothetical protein n=1 Tax=Nocardia sp. NPDC058058 TaxID=3346317 RepID=UPI0036D9DD6F